MTKNNKQTTAAHYRNYKRRLLTSLITAKEVFGKKMSLKLQLLRIMLKGTVEILKMLHCTLL